MNRYRLIALDVDGTLITDDHRLTPKTREAVRAVHERGARIVLCTGRGAVSTLPLLEQLGLDGIIITHNGGATIDSRDRRVLHTFGYPVERVMPLVRYCRERGIHFDINTAFDIYVERLDEDVKAGYRLFFAEPVLLPDVSRFGEPVIKFCAIAEPPVVERFMQDWREIGSMGLRMMRSGAMFVDVLHEKSSKGGALRVLAERWGIPREQVLAIGNYYNDLEMIEYAGLGIAMANSPDEVKRAADAVTGSNNDDGVREALVRYCLEGD
jgi:hypothetical protein